MTVVIPFPKMKYKVIYADPPWRFETWSRRGKGRSAERHYNTMALEDIKKLPVYELADEDCVLFLWSTSSMLKNAISVIESWGFIYKTVAFNWIKTYASGKLIVGMGFWTRLNSEICLLGIRGNPKRVSFGVNQVIISKRGEHSRKPDLVRDRIVEMMGDVPRIELFARQRFEGWGAWGDEIINDNQKQVNTS